MSPCERCKLWVYFFSRICYHNSSTQPVLQETLGFAILKFHAYFSCVYKWRKNNLYDRYKLSFFLFYKICFNIMTYGKTHSAILFCFVVRNFKIINVLEKLLVWQCVYFSLGINFYLQTLSKNFFFSEVTLWMKFVLHLKNKVKWAN